ncbi:hypothetical protein [Nonlabens antarcticus]|uniref:hypothetical protein n=1 Tax=Nonlabens antarcticus TaxID=392714 RepID=UPI001891D943|nr:hypothetical protein [Nonlabens antarcticus]
MFKFAPGEPTQFALSGDSEKKYLDLPTIRANGYRLSTAGNYAYHLGNVLEPWMKQAFDEVKQRDEVIVQWPQKRRLDKSKFGYFIKNRFFKKLLSNPYIYNMALRKFGLRKEWEKYYFK